MQLSLSHAVYKTCSFFSIQKGILPRFHAFNTFNGGYLILKERAVLSWKITVFFVRADTFLCINLY